MRFQLQLFVIFTIMISVTIGVVTFFAIKYIESEVIRAEISKMHNDDAEIKFNIQKLHEGASEDMIFALHNPIFVEYFSLPETREGNVYDDNGVLQFTNNQKKLKDQLDTWIYHFQNKFEVDETCLIDNTGQEHTRLVLTQIAPNDELSSEEKNTPFFEQSLRKQKNEVFIQYPYVSPDTHRWVFAYTTPIVLDNGYKPAFFHFEMPLEIFQSLVESTSDGFTYVVDPNGFLIASSKENLAHKAIKTTFPNEYFPSVKEIFGENSEFLMNVITKDNSGDGVYNSNGEDHYFVYEKLPTFDWVLVYEKPTSAILVGNQSLSSLIQTMIVVSIGLIGASMIAALVISRKISSPIIRLSKAINAENPERLEALSIPNNEIGLISKSINSLLERIDNFQNDISLQNHELEIQKNQLEKLAKIGEITSRLIHNLRNPLTVIKSSIDLIQLKPEELDTKILEKLNNIQNACDSITKQIEDVLTFVKDRPPMLQKISLNQVLKRSIKLFTVPNSVTIKLPDNDYELAGDPDKLELVFMNLFTNSIDAMNKVGTITVNAFRTNSSLEITVVDSGPGFSNEIKEKIFDTLFTTKPSGTGLGLPYCKSIIEQHGGSILVDTNPTKFSIILPLKTQEILD